MQSQLPSPISQPISRCTCLFSNRICFSISLSSLASSPLHTTARPSSSNGSSMPMHIAFAMTTPTMADTRHSGVIQVVRGTSSECLRAIANCQMKLSTMVERSTTFIRLFDVSLLSQRPADKLLGGAVTLGFAVLMGRLYLRCLQNMDDQRSWASLLQNFLQFLNGDQTIENKGGFLHRGCCHCGAIEFEAGRIIRARRGGGKINYAHLRTLATNIRVTRGAHQLRIYYVATSLCPNEEALDLGAFMFCTTCGVHLLHAENANSALLDVNVHCLDNQASIELTSHKHDLSIGKKAAQKNHATPECDFEGDFSHFVQNHDWSNQQLTVPGPIEPLQNKLASPSTPSTQYSGESAATGGGMDHDSASSGPGEPEGLRNGTGGDLLLVDTIYPQRQEGGRASTTPMMRDQLKHYMKKHLKSTKSEA